MIESYPCLCFIVWTTVFIFCSEYCAINAEAMQCPILCGAHGLCLEEYLLKFKHILIKCDSSLKNMPPRPLSSVNICLLYCNRWLLIYLQCTLFFITFLCSFTFTVSSQAVNVETYFMNEGECRQNDRLKTPTLTFPDWALAMWCSLQG